MRDRYIILLRYSLQTIANILEENKLQNKMKRQLNLTFDAQGIKKNENATIRNCRVGRNYVRLHVALTTRRRSWALRSYVQLYSS